MYWWLTTKHPVRYLIVPAMILCCLLTGSRSGIIGSALAALALPLLGFSDKDWNNRYLIRFAITVSVMVLLVLFNQDIIQFLSRENQADDFTTLNSRTRIWEAAAVLVERSPWIGHGFIAGPKLIGTLFSDTLFEPSNGENEIVNAAVAGGIPGAVFLCVLYGTLIVQAFRFRRRCPLLCVTVIPLFISAMFEPNLSSVATISAVITVGLVRTFGVMSARERGSIAEAARLQKRR
jgi:O-antigen ligase